MNTDIVFVPYLLLIYKIGQRCVYKFLTSNFFKNQTKFFNTSYYSKEIHFMIKVPNLCTILINGLWGGGYKGLLQNFYAKPYEATHCFHGFEKYFHS